jgi:hypothetical protein
MWETIAIFAFGVSFVAVILLIVFRVPNPTPFQYIIVRIILALSAAAVATLLTGFIEVQIPDVLKAGGALGVFAVVYFFSPAALRAARSDRDAAAVLEVGAEIEVLPGGQKNVVMGPDGIVSWQPEMSKYRSRSGRITHVEELAGGEKILRLTVDSGANEWHPQWIRVRG